ncbi:fe(2+) transport protein 1-like [Prunus yedoensis var. nudiflora]|uniref:Fe(2+) transport protein 1-like n=1 Tax=Prunus yedoensis var. nudiflora TaxID=2094558 RepID=A0A314XN53_PRUYE|nr:fe(2+) transport protein 1-like [Prunus yedoensis var. nudiflora]
MAQVNLSSPNFFIIFISILTPQVHSQSDECGTETNSCNDKSGAVPLKVIAITTILVTSMIGVSLPLVTRSIPALHPDRNLFVIVKCFAAGIILATGFMHVLPDSFDMLSSNCLKENPWHKFPFSGTGVIPDNGTVAAVEVDQEMAAVGAGHGHFHAHSHDIVKEGNGDSQLPRYRVVAMVLELGIIVHSVVIGLSLGASNNTCTIKGLVAALCFHQMFEGMGLGGCILQAEYKFMKKAIMVFFFSTQPIRNCNRNGPYKIIQGK